MSKKMSATLRNELTKHAIARFLKEVIFYQSHGTVLSIRAYTKACFKELQDVLTKIHSQPMT